MRSQFAGYREHGQDDRGTVGACFTEVSKPRAFLSVQEHELVGV